MPMGTAGPLVWHDGPGAAHGHAGGGDLGMTSPAAAGQGTILRGEPGPLGYRRLVAGPARPHLLRGGPGPRGPLRAVLCLVHLTDLHVMDSQSPARMDFLDRLGDSDSPYAAYLGRVGAYRPQEPLSFHVVEAMARAAAERPTSR
jgi:hypothetical protein